MARNKEDLMVESLLSAAREKIYPLVVNSEAVGNSTKCFLEQINDQIPGFVRNLSFQNPKEFKALQFMVMLNQSANIEKKLGLLIVEMRETNRLLREKINSTDL